MTQILNVLLQITIYSGVLFAAVMLLKKGVGKKCPLCCITLYGSF